MIEVTILILDETFSSTAIGPMEVFRHAGRFVEFSYRDRSRRRAFM